MTHDGFLPACPMTPDPRRIVTPMTHDPSPMTRHAVTIVDRLADYASALRYEDLPPEVVHQAKRMIVDTFGCALGGYDSEPAAIARGLAETVTSSEPATLLCTGRQSSPDLAAFANGVAIRYLDFNDGYTGKQDAGHPSDSIAALLTAAEIGKRGGRDLVLGTVLSYETFCRLCDAFNTKSLGFDHVTHGAIAAVVGAGRLMGLTRGQLAAAVNLTAAANVALYQTRIGNVAMWKGCAFANASRNALFAAQLAARGMTGPSPIYEGRGGFFTAVSRKPFELDPFGGADTPFLIMQCFVKRFPLGQYSQSVVQAALEAREVVGRDVTNIAEVHVRTLATAVHMMAGDPDKWRPANRETADHSMPYTAGVALMHGTIESRHFDDPYLHDPTLLDLVGRIRCSISPEADAREPEAMLCELDVKMKNGRQQTVRVEYHRGHWKNPMSDTELEEKFRPLAAHVLPASRIDALLARLWVLESVGDVAELFRLTRK